MNKDECKQFSRQGLLYIYQELSSSGRKSFETHLKDCPICQEKLTDFSRVISEIKGVRPLKPGAKAVEKIVGVIKSKPARPASRPGWRRQASWLPRLALGLAAVVLIALVWLLITTPDRPSQAPPVIQGKEAVPLKEVVRKPVQPQPPQPLKQETASYEWEDDVGEELTQISNNVTILNWSLKPISYNRIERRLEQLQERIDEISEEID